MNLYITFLFQLFTATFTGLAIKWTNSIWFIKPDFFSNCSSHTSQDNNVLTKHNPSTPISFQNVNHILHKTTMYWPDTTLLIEDFERISLGFGVGVVNSDKIDEGEETEDFDKDLRKLFKQFNFIIVTFWVTTLLQTITLLNIINIKFKTKSERRH